MPEANVLYSVTAVVVVGLVAWVAVVLKTAKEPWSRPAVPQPRSEDVPVEGEASEAAKADEDKPAKTDEPEAKADEDKPAKTDEPEAKADEPKPEAKADEPKPEAKADEPAAKADEPAAKADEPEAKAEKSST